MSDGRDRDYRVPIRFGTEATDEPGGLSKERAAELDRRLRELRAARTQALIDSRNFLVLGADRD